jgi:hypothetical protein
MPDTNPLGYQHVIKTMTDELPAEAEGTELDSPDRRDGSVYCYDSELHLAVELALSTGRPLLLRGDPGSGKSSLAAYVARNLGWRYYEHVVTSATQAQDLLWRYDAVRRLADAQARPRAERLRVCRARCPLVGIRTAAMRSRGCPMDTPLRRADRVDLCGGSPLRPACWGVSASVGLTLSPVRISDWSSGLRAAFGTICRRPGEQRRMRGRWG